VQCKYSSHLIINNSVIGYYINRCSKAVTFIYQCKIHTDTCYWDYGIMFVCMH
jgi:hypothetical protein